MGNFNFKDTTVVYGTSTLTGFTASGEAINIVSLSDDNITEVDAHDNTTRIALNNSTCEVTLTFTQWSPSNQILSTAANNAKNGVVIPTPLEIKNSGGLTNFYSPNAYVKAWPEIGYGQEGKDRVWVLTATNCVKTEGGLI